MTKEEYKVRLQSQDWKDFSYACKLKMDNQCQMCGYRTNDHGKLHVHHMSYSLIDLENE